MVGRDPLAELSLDAVGGGAVEFFQLHSFFGLDMTW